MNQPWARLRPAVWGGGASKHRTILTLTALAQQSRVIANEQLITKSPSEDLWLDDPKKSRFGFNENYHPPVAGVRRGGALGRIYKVGLF